MEGEVEPIQQEFDVEIPRDFKLTCRDDLLPPQIHGHPEGIHKRCRDCANW